VAPVVVGLPTQNPDPNEDMDLVSMDLVRRGESNQMIPNHPKNLEFPNVPVIYSDVR
jgi:hypothetical protein